MTAEREKHFDDLDVIDRPSAGTDGRDQFAPWEGDIDDGETTLEDSGAGSFLDRFVPPRAPDRR